MIQRLRGAIQFLTILPVGGQTAPAGQAALFFPAVGAALGWLGAQAFTLLSPALGSSLAALAVVLFWTLITGGLHEDGVADVADALRVHRKRESMLAILKDSRIGSYGAAALIFLIAVRWQAVMRLPSAPIAELTACLALSRASLVAQAWVSRPVGDGLGAAFSNTLTSTTAILAILQGVALAFLPGPRAGLLLILGAVFLTGLLNRWFDARIGGVNGDCLGATCLFVETFLLVLVSCRNCF
jgi:adenosylcobinamide-GDP ribazoletransferase